MDWNDYLRIVVDKKTEFDNVRIGNSKTGLLIAPIVKASVLMLDEISKAQGDNSIIVFPEVKQLGVEFLIAKTIHSIASGTIGTTYDPYSFVKGQKLKFVDCVVTFDKCGIDADGKEKIWIDIGSNAPVSQGIPIELAPFFQMVDSKRLSPYHKFADNYKKYKLIQESQLFDGNDLTQMLLDYKTHLDGSIIFISEIKRSKELLLSTTINGKNLQELLYLAHINGDGVLSNLASGQLSGNPAIAIATDLYSVVNAADKLPIKSVIFDASNSNGIDGQLDMVDELIKRGVPIICVTDTANSFDNEYLTERGFNEWRWDKSSISPALYRSNGNRYDTRIRNCALQNVEYECINNSLVSSVLEHLYEQKQHVQEQSTTIISAYDKLFSTAFSVLRRITPLSLSEKEHYDSELCEIKGSLEKENRFIAPELLKDFLLIIDSLHKLICETTTVEKRDCIERIIKNAEVTSVCIVVSEKQNKEDIKNYWRNMFRSRLNLKIQFMYPNEYVQYAGPAFDITIVVGWLSSKIMKNIIYQFTSEHIYVLLYSYEKRWKDAHTKAWKKKLINHNNRDIVQKAFKKWDVNIKDEAEELPSPAIEETSSFDELEDIEQFLLVNKYRKYGSGSSNSETIVDAIPVSFVGGLLSFFRKGHKVITVTDIVQQTGTSLKFKQAEDLSIGDFIIIREAQKDIIRELADNILAQDGKSTLRPLSQKWRESLKIEAVFSDMDSIYNKLKDAGCKRDYNTVRTWMTNEDLIAPQNKEDLINIAVATNDEVLLEKADLYFAAAQAVKSAHIKAGRNLSEKLINSISGELKGMDDIDPFNIWDPIIIKMDDIGIIKILKIIDKGSVVQVEVTNTNRLINE